jgi:hypothetical protein
VVVAVVSWYLKKLMLFYEKPRGRVLSFIGMVLIAPNVQLTEMRIKSLEKEYQEQLTLKGRLDLLTTLLLRWWNK